MIAVDLTILLAEDNEDEATLFQMAMEKANVPAQLQTVRDGEKAISYLKGEGTYADRTAHPIPDILLLDLNMPRVNGFEVLEWVRDHAPYQNLIVYVLSASSREVDVQRVYDLHANSYVRKPGRMDDLTAFVHALVTWHKFICPPRLPLYQPEQTQV